MSKVWIKSWSFSTCLYLLILFICWMMLGCTFAICSFSSAFLLLENSWKFLRFASYSLDYSSIPILNLALSNTIIFSIWILSSTITTLLFLSHTGTSFSTFHLLDLGLGSTKSLLLLGLSFRLSIWRMLERWL